MSIFSRLFHSSAGLSTVVQEGKEYPNHHHVPGVGYYHAADRQWYPKQWNSYEEGLGFYWQGCWQKSPDLREVECSVPPPEEVERVNREWRAAGHGVADGSNPTGFGTSFARREGS